MLRIVSLLAFIVVAGAPLPRPREASASDWPVERFVRNLEARLAVAPTDPAAHYTLGRVHAFAFALERSTLLGGGDEDFTWLKHLGVQREHRSKEPAPPPTPAERLTHLGEGVRHLRRACELEDSAMHRLTLAWLLETGAPLAAEVDTTALLGLEAPESPAERETIARWIEALGSEGAEAEEARRRLAEPATLEHALLLLAAQRSSEKPRRREAVGELLRLGWIERAIAEYRRCLDLVEEQSLFEDPMIQGPLAAQVPREALEAYRRLVRARGVHGPEEEQSLAAADARWRELEERPRSAFITPILLALDGCPTLAGLTRPALHVPFDLDGDGVDELWPWLAPEAGWLVWDPSGKGEILSGRQLFGSASGWLFFEDGYCVLDALDDDRDGALRGAELAGIAVWFDRDIDGISDCGEVVPVEALGIVALATAVTLHVGASPANLCGFELADGRILPTYDWVLESRREP
ncbi:MAG: hypothetical protein HOP15_08325 [Planctomycetes bacterium]|nr:hypothetical protein [Planctomycetota bacterium]